MRNILICNLEEQQKGLTNLLDQVTTPENNCGLKKDDYWVIKLDRQPFFHEDGTEEVRFYNQMVHNSLTQGYTDLLIKINQGGAV